MAETEQTPESTEEPRMADWKASVEYVGFYSRVSAHLIDSAIILLPLAFILSMLIPQMMGGQNFGPSEAAMVQQAYSDPERAQHVLQELTSGGFIGRWLMENLLFSLFLGGVLIGLWYYFSATPGKLIMGMKIVDAETGLPANNGQNILRYIGYLLSGLFFCIGFFWVMWDKRHQGWHDKMAGTVVVYKKTLPPELADLTLAKP